MKHAEQCGHSIERQIHYLVSGQIEREIDAQSDLADQILSTVAEAIDKYGDPIEIFEWWTVSDDFAFRAEKVGEIIVETPFGIIWGRQTTGMALVYDPIVKGILQRMPV
jgi:hypothetical protein